MKRYMPIVFAIIIGIIFGNIIFNSYKTETVMMSDGNVYMLQYGAYTSKSVMLENTKNLNTNDYIVEQLDDIYYVYFGITTNYDNALTIVDIYKNNNIFLYIKENYLGRSELINKLKEIDLLIKKENDSEKIIDYFNDSLLIYQNN